MPFNRHRDMNFISYSITNIPLYIKIISYLCNLKNTYNNEKIFNINYNYPSGI